jgi:RimJ/RimL family protein N-acetyltransferase
VAEAHLSWADREAAVRLPERIETARLVLRRPLACDAAAVYSGWASDAVATRFMSWPRHRRLADSHDFLDFSDVEWDTWPAGPYVIELGVTGELIGSCGFAFRGSGLAEVGYIIARRAWGQGYATESLAAQIVAVAPLAPITLGATVHPDNAASLRVLEKCGFASDGAPSVAAVFPNVSGSGWVCAVRYARVVG